MASQERSRSSHALLGVDIGGVIIDRANDTADTSLFGERYLSATPVVGAVESLKRLSASRFHDRIVLVSTCGPRIEARTREWLSAHDFFGITGISKSQLHFTRSRVDKAPVCARLGVTHFVDDHVEVLLHLDSVAYRFLFTGGSGGRMPSDPPEPIRRADTWPELVTQLEDSARRCEESERDG